MLVGISKQIFLTNLGGIIMKKTITLFTCLLLFTTLLVSPQISANEEITLAECNWPGIRAKNKVGAYILENIGYEVTSTMVSDQVAHQGIASGRLDIHLGSWMPSMTETRTQIEDKIDVPATNTDECMYTMAVPQYVWEAGVKSYTDLDKYAEKFDRTMYTGPIGWQSTKTMKKAVDNDIYSLGDWKVQTSTNGALMARIKKAVNNQEWIVFIGWQPHWMNHLFDIKYLKDPQGLWENPESWVDTLARKGLKEDQPEVYKFFKQYKLSTQTCSTWIYEIGQQDKDPSVVAKNWVQNNLNTVKPWLEGVKATNGKPAFEVLKENIK
jgi:glycine betaine/proline transport system substrate-binding protein